MLLPLFPAFLRYVIKKGICFMSKHLDRGEIRSLARDTYISKPMGKTILQINIAESCFRKLLCLFIRAQHALFQDWPRIMTIQITMGYWILANIHDGYET